MKILIIENDTYLAQSISNKLEDRGYECVISKDLNLKLDKNNAFDIVLMSYDLCQGSCTNAIKHFKESIIIVMIKYINDDTVTKMFKAGMHDYVIKPIIVDELIRKIEHYREFDRLQKEVVFYKNYFEFVEGILNTPFPFTYNLPFIIRSSSQRSADIYAMRYARLKNIHFNFLSLKEVDWKSILNINNNVNEIVYLTGLEQIKKSERNELIDKLHKQNVLFSFVSQEEITFSNIVDISVAKSCMDMGGEIMPIRDYEKMMIAKYEGLYSDIELAKELGISRKSLWEKRKRYGIVKQRKSVKQSRV
ncbi:MAG: response regulator [Helicobacteraceae bacterium]|nr:response regulator [Helicobacteraceae bacterium]